MKDNCQLFQWLVTIRETLDTLEKWHFLLREQEVSEMLGVAIATLQAWRRVAKPPAFIRLGRAVRYRLSDLRELIRQGGYANGQDAS